MFSKILQSKDMVFNQRVIVRQILNAKVAAVLLAINTTFLAVPHALAENLSSYCIIKLPKQKQEYNARQVTVSVKGVPFHIVASSAHVFLRRNLGDPTFISSVSAPQHDFNIESLTLGKSGWLWIDGRDIDYMVKIDLNTTPPTFGTPLPLPDLKAEPCSYLWSFFGFCRRASAIYSTTLDRAFITGHRPTFLGFPDEVSFEMVTGKLKNLPPELKGFRWVQDVLSPRGVLFTNNAGKDLFYDGITLTPLMSEAHNWKIYNETGSVKTFLAKFQNSMTILEAVFELKAGPTLTPISVPEGLTNYVVKLFEFPTDSQQLWIEKDKSIAVGFKGRFRPVVTVTKEYSIRLGQLDGNLNITVELSSGGSTNYSIVKALPATQCIAKLNPDKPILLGIGSNKPKN